MVGKPALLVDQDHPDWVPSQNMGYNVGILLKRPLALQRKERVDKRKKIRIETVTAVS